MLAFKHIFIHQNLVSALIGLLLIYCGLNVDYSTRNASSNPELLILTLVVAAIGLIFCRSKSFTFTKPDALMMAAGVLFLIVFSQHPLWRNGAAACLIVLYASIRLSGRTNVLMLYVSLLCFILILSITGYLQYTGRLESENTYFTITGPYVNPSVYGCVLSISLCAPALFLMRSSCWKKYRILSVVTLVVVLFCIPVLILSESRTAALALFLSILCSIYISRKNIFKTKARKYLIFSALFIFVVLVSYPLYCYKKDSADGRLLIWKVTMEMVKDKPLTGFGADGFTANYMLYQAKYLETKGTDREKQLARNNFLVYNEPLRMLVEHGVIGLLLYGGFIAVLLSIPKKKNMIMQSAYIIGINYLIIGLFTYPQLIYPMPLIMLLACSFVPYNKRQVLLNIRLSANINRLVIAGLLAILVGLLYPVLKNWYGYYRFNRLHETPYLVSEPEEYLSGLSGLENLMAGETVFWSAYCTMLDKQKQDSLLIKKITAWENLYPVSQLYLLKGGALQRTGKTKEAEAAYWTAHYMAPSMQTPRVRIAILYNETGREEEGLQLAREILAEEVKVYGFDTFRLHRELKNTFGLHDKQSSFGEEDSE